MSSKPNLQVVKIGGNVIDNPSALASFLTDFASLEGPKILVHGGGVLVDRHLARLGVVTERIEGWEAHPLSLHGVCARYA